MALAGASAHLPEALDLQQTVRAADLPPSGRQKAEQLLALCVRRCHGDTTVAKKPSVSLAASFALRPSKLPADCPRRAWRTQLHGRIQELVANLWPRPDGAERMRKSRAAAGSFQEIEHC